MNAVKPLRLLSVAFVLAAAVAAGYGVYAAERTEPVVVALQPIAPFTTITSQNVSSDFAIKNIPISAVEPGALASFQGLMAHTTQTEILADAQVQVPMLNADNSLQALVNSNTTPGNVTFGVSYKQGSMDQYIAPDSFVDLAAPGQNGMTIHADHVLILQNSGYSPVTTSTTSQNQQNQTLVMTLPESTYLSLFQAISTSAIQVLLIPQNQAYVAPTNSLEANSQPSQTQSSITSTVKVSKADSSHQSTQNVDKIAVKTQTATKGGVTH